MNEHVIRANTQRSFFQRALDGFVTLLFWIGYLYLMRNVFSVALSSMGVPAPWGIEVANPTVGAIVGNLLSYGMVILINAGILIGWARYNQIVFGKRNRRRRSDPLTPRDMAVFFHMNEAQVVACQEAKRNVMTHNQVGILVDCDAFRKDEPPPQNGHMA